MEYGNHLFVAFVYVLCSPFQYGYSFAVTNLIQPYVACWINEVTVGNLRQTQCVNAANISDSSIQEQLQAVDNSWALVTAIWNVGGMLMCFAAGPMSDYFGPKKC